MTDRQQHVSTAIALQSQHILFAVSHAHLLSTLSLPFLAFVEVARAFALHLQIPGDTHQ